jgi:hypothetical protein
MLNIAQPYRLPRPVTEIALLNLYASKACYGDSVNFFMCLHGLLRGWLYLCIWRDVLTSQDTYGPPRPVTGIALPLDMEMIFVPHRIRTGLHGLLRG